MLRPKYHTFQDVYTLNFAHFHFIPIRYFLELYPVFCLTASYPIIGITLRNNLKTLFSKGEYPWLVDRVSFFLRRLRDYIFLKFSAF